MNYQPTIGLEIHAELDTRTKMFCASLNDPSETKPNVNVCPICMGHPGTLPVPNKEAVEKVIKVGLALNGEAATFSQFDRKNYFYPDLPKGYQISQYQHPLVRGGYLEIDLPNNPRKKIRIQRIHLEEDTGRLFHDEKTKTTLIDFNRAGIPLLELVTEPDMTSGAEVKKFGEELQKILRYLGASNAEMEKGQMRVEVNISLSNQPRIASNESRIMLKRPSYDLMKLLFEVHNKLGPIYKEKNYQDAIEETLKRESVSYEREKHITLRFENLEVSDFFADFVVEGKILLEIKARPFITNDDIHQASRYLKSLEIPLAIIANFKRQKLEYKRIVNPAFESDSSLFEDNSRSIFGTKVEMKNINSFKFAADAVGFEIRRQSELLERGVEIKRETRGWDEKRGVSITQRFKEESEDYRYFPEPDIPPLRFTPSFIEEIRRSLPELPAAKLARFESEFGIDAKIAETLVQNKDMAGFFEATASELGGWLAREPGKAKDQKPLQLAANYLTTNLAKLFLDAGATPDESLVTPENFAELITYIYEGRISSLAAKEVLKEMSSRGDDPSDIISQRGLWQISGRGEVSQAVEKVISANAKAAKEYFGGKTQVLQFLVGQVMKEAKGANPEVVQKLLEEKLKRD